MKQNKKKKQGGFTVIELIVAAALFSIFVAVAVGSFNRVIQVQRTLSRRIMLTSALGSAIESMAREIRVGYKFPIEKNNEEMSSISFESFATHAIDPVPVSFSISGQSIKRTDPNGEYQLTPSTVVIKSGTFIVNESDCGPWRITIVLSAYPQGSDKPEDTISLQTTVTSRVLPADVKGDPYSCKEM